MIIPFFISVGDLWLAKISLRSCFSFGERSFIITAGM